MLRESHWIPGFILRNIFPPPLKNWPAIHPVIQEEKPIQKLT